MFAKTFAVLAIVTALMVAGRANAALIVTGTTNGTTLVNSLLSASSGITASNISVLGSAGTILQSGTFSGGLSVGLPFDSGITLSTGNVAMLQVPCPNPPGPPICEAFTQVGTPGDALLNAIVSPSVTLDAAVLEFDFVPNGNQIDFSYVFGSGEYNTFVNRGFNDVFAFFVNGVNVALVPGTNTAVSIDTVNCGQSNVTTGPGNPGGSNCDQFINNRTSLGRPSENIAIALGGFTQEFSAVASVNPGIMNTMYLAIADTHDPVLDSAVFLRGGTLSICGGSDQPSCGTVPEPASLALLCTGLVGLLMLRCRGCRSAPAEE